MRQLARHIIVSILTWEAHRVVQKWKPTVVLVSGSVGKTTTKDSIFHLISEHGHVRKSPKSFNSEIGVPLTILGLPNAWQNPLGWMRNLWYGYRLVATEEKYPDTLVLEVGSDHPNDIANLLNWLHPDIVVVTSLPEIPVHVENFASPEDIRHEDGLVVSALGPSGVYVANADDKESLALIKAAHARGVRTLSYGFSQGAQLRGKHPKIRYAVSEGASSPAGMQFEVVYEGENYPVYINGVLGVQACMAVLAGLAVGVLRGTALSRLVDDVITFVPPIGRMGIISGKSGSTLIDDSYNSSPIALDVALTTLQDIEAPRKIAMLGDMLELGNYSDAEHWKAGRKAGGFVDELVTVGVHARLIAEGAKSAGLLEGRIHPFEDSEQAGNYVKDILRPGDVVLVKGSQGSGEHMIRMERAVKILMLHQEDAPRLLVRQEEEWQKQYI